MLRDHIVNDGTPIFGHFACLHCGQLFLRMADLVMHVWQEHVMPLKEKLDIGQEEKGAKQARTGYEGLLEKSWADNLNMGDPLSSWLTFC